MFLGVDDIYGTMAENECFGGGVSND